MVTKVRGSFNEFEGVIQANAEDPTKSTAEVTIDVASVDTRNEQRDGHQRTNDFFDAPSFPKMTFKSTSIERVDEDHFRMTGDLTIKETTKPVTIDWEYTGSA